MNLTLENWSIWMPGIESASAYVESMQISAPPPPDDGEGPGVTFLPAMFRRRLSRLSRMALRVAHDCLLPDQIDTCRLVFASRHGEVPRTISLLQKLAHEESLSPTDFAMSVHNTAAGLFSIWAGNHHPNTAIAAGPETMAAGLLEALCQAHTSSAPLLYVFADEQLPAFYAGYDTEQPLTCALAMLFQTTVGGDGQQFDWRHEASANEAPRDFPQVMAMAQWLSTPTPSALRLHLQGGQLILERTGTAPA